ncbi:acyltransferase family protein [Ectobacillus polymachus]|uniref:acyltransferase family protein n=1 Tax=Ectobacillus polymachus TaxID=1508806 RepID=UPI003A897535
MKTKQPRLQLVQASRAIVPLLVILFHTSFVSNQYFNFNLLGLTKLSRIGGADYFFVLTGFMMYYVYAKDFGIKEKFRPFLIKRFTRIIPYYWLLTIVMIVFFYFVPIGYGYGKNLQTMLNSFLLLPSQDFPIIYSAWSLRYTLLFYFVFSLFIYSNSRFMKTVVGLWIASILYFSITSTTFSNDFLAMIFNKINLEFVAGVCCAYYAMHRTIKHGMVFLIASAIGFGYTWISGVYNLWRFDETFMYTICATALILGIVSIDMTRQIKLPRIFNYLGNASFSIYLVHPPFLGFVAAMLVKLGITSVIGSVGSIIVTMITVTIMGCLAHSYIEKPLVASMKNMIPKPKSAPLLLRETSAKL